MDGSTKSRHRDAERRGPYEDRDRKERRPHNGHAPTRNGAGDHGTGGGAEADNRRRGLSGARAVLYAKSNLMELTGTAPEAVSSLVRTSDGWRVILEVVELERIPRTTDIMASYAVDLDADGELMAYQRVGRYYRSDVKGDQ